MAKQKFQIGDRVRVLGHQNRFNKIYTVYYCHRNHDYSRIFYDLVIGDYRLPCWFYSYELEKVETENQKPTGPKSKFKNGESVLIPEGFKLKKYEKQTPQSVSGTITISLKQAKEYYEIGGELKKIALQAYTEEELKPEPKVPQTWDDYCDNFYPYEKHMHYIPKFAHGFSGDDADALIAYGRLIRLRRAWLQTISPDVKWNNHAIVNGDQGITIYSKWHTNYPLSFPSYDMADKFLNCFKDLLEKAKGLF